MSNYRALTYQHESNESGLLAGAPRYFKRVLGVGAVRPTVDLQIDGGELIWSQWLAINASVALIIAAMAANGSRADQPWAVPGFYFATVLMFMPIASRLALAEVSRSERVANVMVAGLGLFMLHVIREPTFFTGHDEYLHWVGARQMMESGKLFTPNVLFPIGPSYPGLEIVSSALVDLSGLSIFVSATIVLLVARTIFIGALFLVYERITSSARVAALGCIFYMGSSTFTFFDTSFSYGSLAIALLALCLLLDLRVGEAASQVPLRMLMFFVAVLALSMTHHLTSYALAGLLSGMFFVEAIRRGRKGAALARLGATAFCACLVPYFWSRAMGNPGSNYLGPLFHAGIQEALAIMARGFHSNRQLFVSSDGSVAPIWERATAFGSVLLICVGLTLGFFRALSWAGLFAQHELASKGWRSLLEWNNSRLVLLTLVTTLYPVSMIFRLTKSAWEIGNRIGPFSFLGVGVVLAICITSLFGKGSVSTLRAIAIGAASTVILLGGMISAQGPRILVPAHYRVSADEASIEPMNINAALWAKAWLGSGNHFGADRTNSLLLAGFGEQLVSTSLQHGADAGTAIVTRTLGPGELFMLRDLGIDYLFEDLRLTTGQAVLGTYFDGGAADDLLDGPPEPTALLKFDSEPGVSRVFDNGYSIVYDVRVLSGRK